MMGKIVKSIFICILLSIVFLAVGCLIAFPLSKYFKTSYNDVVFIEGIITTVISAYASIQGGLGVDLSGLGDKNVQYDAYRKLEVTKMERRANKYYEDFKNKSVVNLSFTRLIILLGGIFLIICSVVGIMINY